MGNVVKKKKQKTYSDNHGLPTTMNLGNKSLKAHKQGKLKLDLPVPPHNIQNNTQVP